MININDLDVKLILINEFTIFENGSVIFDISCCKENNTPHVVFNNVECIFKKRKGRKEEILFIEDEKEDFIMAKDFMRFRFKTNDNLLYNQKIYVKVCVISISGVFEERDWYYPKTELQDCFYESSEN